MPNDSVNSLRIDRISQIQYSRCVRNKQGRKVLTLRIARCVISRSFIIVFETPPQTVMQHQHSKQKISLLQVSRNVQIIFETFDSTSGFNHDKQFCGLKNFCSKILATKTPCLWMPSSDRRTLNQTFSFPGLVACFLRYVNHIWNTMRLIFWWLSTVKDFLTASAETEIRNTTILRIHSIEKHLSENKQTSASSI